MAAMVLLYSTFPSRDEAVRMAGTVLESRLAACVNIFPIDSMYHWDGEIQRDEEFAALFKTTVERADELTGAIRKAHPYDTPAIIRVEADSADPGYSDWLVSECSRAGDGNDG